MLSRLRFFARVTTDYRSTVQYPIRPDYHQASLIISHQPTDFLLRELSYSVSRVFAQAKHSFLLQSSSFYLSLPGKIPGPPGIALRFFLGAQPTSLSCASRTSTRPSSVGSVEASSSRSKPPRLCDAVAHSFFVFLPFSMYSLASGAIPVIRSTNFSKKTPCFSFQERPGKLLYIIKNIQVHYSQKQT